MSKELDKALPKQIDVAALIDRGNRFLEAVTAEFKEVNGRIDGAVTLADNAHKAASFVLSRTAQIGDDVNALLARVAALEVATASCTHPHCFKRECVTHNVNPTQQMGHWITSQWGTMCQARKTTEESMECTCVTCGKSFSQNASASFYYTTCSRGCKTAGGGAAAAAKK